MCVLRKSGKTTTRKDQRNYCMLKNLRERSKEISLRLYNKIWEVGYLPKQWNESVIVPDQSGFRRSTIDSCSNFIRWE